MRGKTIRPSGKKRTSGKGSAKSLRKDAVELHRALSDLVRIYQFRDRTQICYHDVSVTQCYAISTLADQESMPLGRLASALFLDKSTASRMVDALEGKGYIRRGPDPNDGRALRIELTAEGIELHSRIEKSLVDGLKEMLDDFEPAARRVSIDIIARLACAAAARFSCGQPSKADRAKRIKAGPRDS